MKTRSVSPLSSNTTMLLLLGNFVVIFGFIENSVNVDSVTPIQHPFQKAIQIEATPQMWTQNDSKDFNRGRFFTLLQQLKEKNRRSVPILNETNFSSAYEDVYVCWEHNAGSYRPGSYKTVTREEWRYEEEQLDGFELSSVMTNSSGALVGGSCTGGMFLFCVLIYFLYRLLRPELEPTRIDPIVVHVPQQGAVTNQNRANCSRCGNALSSRPPPSECCSRCINDDVIACWVSNSPPPPSEQSTN